MRRNCPIMTATLQLDLSDSLNAEELSELTGIAVEEEKTLERVLFESAKDLIRRRRENRKNAVMPEEVAA